MAAFAYLGLPVTGLIAYLSASDARSRFHGLQAIAIGFVWPLALYISAIGPAVAVQVVFVVGCLVWIGFLLAALIGRDPRLPGVARYLEVLSAASPRGEP